MSLCPLQKQSTNITTELDLPEYESYEDLKQRLIAAITTGGEYVCVYA
jgi:hypothetical protein